MDQSILEAIAKALPAMQMDALRSELDKARKYDDVLKSRDMHQNDASNLRSKVIELEKQVLTKQEIEKRERNLELEILKAKLSYSEGKFEAVQNLAYAAFRNPTVQKSYNKPFVVENNGYTTIQAGSETTTVE